jgi:hypothetical protein
MAGLAGLLNGALLKSLVAARAIQIRFIALLKPPFKSSDDYRYIGWGKKPVDASKQASSQRGAYRGVHHGTV